LDFLDLQNIQNQLNRLPDTFRKPGQTYKDWTNAVALGLDCYTNATNALTAQGTITTSRYKWLDLWGKLFSVSRLSIETDAQYLARILNTINFGNVTPVRIETFLKQSWNLLATVQENFPQTGFVLLFNGQIQNLKQIVQDLNRIRPAGISFTPFYVLNGGLFVNTINFIGNWRVTGDYVSSPLVPYLPGLVALTTNAKNTIPTTFLTDPILTGS
jgi:hypothetical protein